MLFTPLSMLAMLCTLLEEGHINSAHVTLSFSHMSVRCLRAVVCRATAMGIFHANDHCLHLVDVCCFVSLQADDGYLYPLERAFFYIQKPPTLLVHDEIESVEFLRQGGGMLAASAKTFDLSIRMQGDQVTVCDT